MGFFFVHLSVAGSYSYTRPLATHPGARPQNTYIFPPAEAPSSSSDGSGKGASLVHFPCARAGPATRNAISATTAMRSFDMISSFSESGSIFPLHCPVHDVDGPLAGENPADLAGRAGLQPRHRLLAVPSGVRHDDDIVAAAQRVRVGQRLGVGGVERAPGNLLRVQGAHQRLGVDNRAARAVDDEG